MRIAMLLHKSVVHDSRVRREARALADAGHDVVVLELAPVDPSATPGEPFARRSVPTAPWLRRLLPFQLYRLGFAASFVRAVVAERPDVVHAHDAAMLLPGAVGARLVGARLVYDSHELATGVPYRDARWATFVRAIERATVPRCAAVVTVSDGIARRLQELYRLPVRPAVVRNLPDAPPAAADGGRLREAVGLPNAPLVLHQGSAAEGRGVDVLVRALAAVPEAHLVLLGAADAEAAPALAVSAAVGVRDRVHVLPPVPVEELVAWTSQADLGVSLLQDTCENHRYALPNKLFEYVAAGLPVVVSDLPEMRRVVDATGVGWTVDPGDPDAVAAGLRTALAARADAGLRARVAAAAASMTWSAERERLLALYAGLERDAARHVAATYGRYGASARKRRAWSRANAGNRVIRRRLVRQVVAAAGPRLERGGSVLDVGCGSGWMLEELARHGIDEQRLAGVDLLPERVDAARRRVPGADVRHADACRLPFADGTFAVVLLASVLSSIPERGRRAQVLRECRRVLAPDGIVLVYDVRVPNPLNVATGRVGRTEVAAAGLRTGGETTLTVLPSLVRRLGAAAERWYPLLEAIPALRTHRLTIASAGPDPAPRG